jgi:hypothetical protein
MAPAPARADIYSQVLRTYQAQGSIPACQFTSAQLSAALKGVDTYGAQYFADFTDAIQTALAARASGACIQRSAGSRATAALPPLRPGSLTASTSAGLPAPILAMTVLGMLILATFVLRALARAFGWDPAWAARWRHACAEASYRVGGGLGSFADWWRSGG